MWIFGWIGIQRSQHRFRVAVDSLQMSKVKPACVLINVMDSGFLVECSLVTHQTLKYCLIFGSDRSPRRGDVVRASVRLSVRDILQNNSEHEF